MATRTLPWDTASWSKKGPRRCVPLPLISNPARKDHRFMVEDLRIFEQALGADPTLKNPSHLLSRRSGYGYLITSSFGEMLRPSESFSPEAVVDDARHSLFPFG